MGAIASLSLNLIADTSGWSVGLKKASDGAGKFASAASASAATAGKAIGSFVHTSSAGLGSFAKDAAKAAAGLALFEIAKGGLSAALDASIGSVVAGLDRIDQLADKSAQLGVTTEALAGLRHAANLTGSSAEDLDGALEKLNANLGDAAQKGTPAGDALAKLGLNAKDLASVSADQAFKAIVGGFEKVPNAADRASMAMDIFGKGGLRILNTLGSGASEIGRLSDEAAKLGISVSQVDAARIGAAKDSLDRAGAALAGLGNTASVILAPAIEGAATAFTEFLGSTVEGAGGVEAALGGIIDVAGWVADAAAVAANTVESVIGNIVGTAGAALDLIGVEAGASMMKTADTMMAHVEHSLDVMPSQKLGKFLDQVKVKSDAAATAAARVATESMGAAAGSGFDGIGKSVADLTSKLKEQADTLGMSATQADLYRLKLKGASEADLAGAKVQADRISTIEKEKKATDDLAAFAKSTIEDTRTAQEKLAETMGKIDLAHSKGLIDSDTADRATKKAAKDAGGSPEVKLAGAARLGSAEAYSSIVATRSGGGGKGIEQVATHTKSMSAGIQTLVRLMSGQSSPMEEPAMQI